MSMKKERNDMNGQVPEKWSPEGKQLGFYLELFSFCREAHLLDQFRLREFERAYARLGARRIRRWREGGIWGPTIVSWFGGPISIREFNLYRAVVDELTRSNPWLVAIDLGLGSDRVLENPQAFLFFVKGFSAEVMLRFYRRYDGMGVPAEELIRWCVTGVVSSRGEEGGQDGGAGGSRLPEALIAAWLRTGFTPEQAIDLTNAGFSFSRPEEAASRWRERRGLYSWEEFCLSKGVASAFQGKLIESTGENG